MTTPPDPLAAELEGLERLLLDPAFRRDRKAVAALLSDDFCEFGSSGRIYDKAAILDLLACEPELPFTAPTEAEGFAVAHVEGDTALVTYRSTRNGRSTLRSSLWVRQGGAWRVRFHQGTPCA